MLNNIHLLRHDIHSSSDVNFFATGGYDAKVSSLVQSFPTGDSQNLHMYSDAIQELNRRNDQLGFSYNIAEPVDAGLRSLNFDDFLNKKGVYLKEGFAIYLQPDGVSFYNKP